MTLQSFVPLVPFLALLYVVFALAQSLRHRRQSSAASILALIAVVAPLAAYLLSSDATVRASLLTGIAINAVIVFVASLVTLLIERRGKTLDPNHSFGILGVGLSVLLAVVMFAAPLFPTASASFSTAATISVPDTSTTDTASNTANTVLISADMPVVADDASADAAAVDDSAADTTDGAFAPPEMTPGAPMMPPPDTTAADDSGALETTEEAAAPVVEQPPAQGDAEPTAVVTEEAAEDTLRPTPIVFPTATPIPDTTEEASIDAETEMSTQADAICALVVDFNLNLRNLPTTEGTTVLLSIPFGNSVLADSRSADGWYHVSYDGQTGWVSGAYVTAGSGCDALPVVSAS